MYDTSMICTYHLLSDETESDNLYKIQLLQIFDVDNIDKITDEMMDALYEKVSNNNKFTDKCSDVFHNTFGTTVENSDRMGFVIMFHYGLFWITHKCICQQINNGCIDDETMTLFTNELKKTMI